MASPHSPRHASGVSYRNVTKRFGDVVAVDDVSLDVAEGEFLVLVGPSGCGKSTLLRMTAGLVDITDGTLEIGGTLVNDVDPSSRDVAMVFQSYALYPHRTVRGNLAYALRLRRMPKAEIAQRVEAVARMLDISDLLDRRPRELSGGQAQRVALGRAIIRQPTVFLMDEPLSNLDAKLRSQMRTELIKLHQEVKATTIFVTHDQVEAMTMGERIVVLDRGVIQQVGPPRQVYDHPANLFVAGFLGAPPMNLLEAELVAVDGRLVARTDGVEAPVPPEVAAGASERTIALGIRPEDLEVVPQADAQRGLIARGVVDVVELLGGESYVHVTSGSQSLIAKVRASVEPAPGSAIVLTAAAGSAHFFDLASGDRLGTGVGSLEAAT